MACLCRRGQSEQMQLLSLKCEAHRDTQYLQWGAHKMGAHDLVCLKWKRTDQYVSGYIQTRFFRSFKDELHTKTEGFPMGGGCLSMQTFNPANPDGQMDGQMV